MYLIAKAILLDGRFVDWDTSTDEFYFKGFTPGDLIPAWDRNQWAAMMYVAESEAEKVVADLQTLGFECALLGGHGIVFDSRPVNVA